VGKELRGVFPVCREEGDGESWSGDQTDSMNQMKESNMQRLVESRILALAAASSERHKRCS
jgi:hypothetical protein